MTTELYAALIGASAGGGIYMLAIVIRTVLANRSEHNVTRHESRVRFLEAQISEFYGPLVGFLNEWENYSSMLYGIIERLRQQATADGMTEQELLERERAVEERFDREYFEKLSRNVGYLLRSKRHLIHEDSFPHYLREFLVTTVDWQAARSVAEEIGGEYGIRPAGKPAWQGATVREVENVLYELRREYRLHLRRLGRMR